MAHIIATRDHGKMEQTTIIRLSHILLMTAIISGCNSVSVSERQVSQKIFKKIEQTGGALEKERTGQIIQYTIDTETVSVDLDKSTDQRYQDVNAVISGQLKLTGGDYNISTPIIITMSINSALSNSNNEHLVILRDPIISELHFPELYTALASDLQRPLANSLATQFEPLINGTVLIKNSSVSGNVKKSVVRNRIKLTKIN